MTPSALRVVLFGTPAFAVPSLQALLASSHQVVGVVTQPDRPRGRGQNTSDAHVKATALAADLVVLQPTRLNDDVFLDALRALDADIGVVAAYGRILTGQVLAIPPRGLVNVHASLLPRYRGAAPVHRAVMAGESETGVTIMRVVQALDAGPMLAAERRAIGPEETSQEVERDLAVLGARLLVSTLDRLSRGALPEIPQDDATATYAPRITRDDAEIDWTRAASEIHNQIRGLHPWPHAHSYLGSRRVIFLRSRPGRLEGRAEPGRVIEARGDELRIATGAGAIEALVVQAEGKRAMSVRDFLAGHALPADARFTPQP